ncbi:MAG TPA: helix-turn-helix domain-containing protein [bacterium]|nr:helix-turn-helix domain-containing protein [bacterium]
MDYKKIHEMLKYIEFTESEVKAYLALLRKEKCTPAEVGKLAGLSRVKAYDVLNSLEAKGGCIQLNSGRKLYEAVAPKMLLEEAQKNFAQEAKTFQQSLTEVGDTLSKLYRKAKKAGEKIDYVKVMKDPLVIQEELTRLVSNAKEEIVLFAVDLVLEKAQGGAKKKMMEESLIKYKAEFTEALQKRKVKFHSIAGLGKLNHSLVNVITNVYRDYDNVDVKIIDEVPGKVLVIDGREILLGLKSELASGYGLLALHLRDRGLAEVLKRAFYAYFDSAPSVKDMDIEVLLREKRIVLVNEVIGGKH